MISAYELGIKLYQIGSNQRKLILKQTAKDMLMLTDFIQGDLFNSQLSKNLKTLILVYEQNFVTISDNEDPELIKIATGKDHICSPHEPEARFGSKHKNIGYKAQIVETAERDQTNFIVDVCAEDNQETDHGKLEESVDRLKDKDLVPEKIYADQGYISGKTIAAGKEEGIDVQGPVENTGRGMSNEFVYDDEKDQYICPNGKTNTKKHVQTNETTLYRFSIEDCKDCHLKGSCRPKAKNKNEAGRIVRRSKFHDEITARRKLMKTEEYKEGMKNRNAIEGTISALKRGAGFSRCRYRGKKKFSFQMYFSAIAFNIKRLDMAFSI
jgi:hypothetical protein